MAEAWALAGLRQALPGTAHPVEGSVGGPKLGPIVAGRIWLLPANLPRLSRGKPMTYPR